MRADTGIARPERSRGALARTHHGRPSTSLGTSDEGWAGTDVATAPPSPPPPLALKAPPSDMVGTRACPHPPPLTRWFPSPAKGRGREMREAVRKDGRLDR